MKAYQYSIRLLAMRDYSRYKLTKKLLEKEFDQDEIEETINKLIEQKYLQEDEYRRVKIKTYLYKGYGHQYIIQKLKQEEIFISSEDIKPIEKEYDLSAKTIIEQLIEKKLRYKSIPQDYESKQKLKRKIHYFLTSKGHQQEDINSSLYKYFH